jgi:hypothetical protein
MRADLAEEMRDSPPHYVLTVDDETWRVYVYGVSRLSDSWLVQLALFGSAVRTAVIHVTARLGSEAAARDAVNLVREWLRSGDRSTYRFLEAPQRPTAH